ncbi:MAG: hypothetical protein KF894_14845 [Labilithrix sp.]|nr:hypothetical protein [Labilithrix sp.]
MKPLENVIVRARNLRRQKRILSRFPELKDSHCLALADYFEASPQRFFNEQVEQEFSTWLRDTSRLDKCRKAIEIERSRLDIAFRSLAEINGQEWHENSVGTDVDELRLLDRSIHPAYLRLIEAVFATFLLVAARVSRELRGSSTDGLDAFNIVEEIAKQLPLASGAYNHTIRNAIAHGGVSYRGDEVVYADKKRTETLLRSSAVRQVDDLLDTCNAMALALKVFILAESAVPPMEALLQELQAAVEAPWWKVVACLPSELGEGKRQLNIYAETDTRDYLKAQFSATQTAATAEFLVPGFDRYFLSIRSSVAYPGWAGFDGDKLRTARQLDQSAAAYSEALEEKLFFYVPRPQLPRIVASVDTYRASAQANWPELERELRSIFGRPEIVVRHVKCHKDPLLVTEARVIVESSDVRLIRKNARWIIRAVKAEVRKNYPWLSRIPDGYLRAFLFARDYRIRRLSSYGLGEDLIGAITIVRDPRKLIIDLLGSRVETSWDMRICWNTNWPLLGDYLLS